METTMAKPGIDRANTETAEEQSYFSYQEAFEAFRSLMDNRGYQLRAEGTDGLCGWEVYERSYGLLGLQVPKGWYYWKKVQDRQGLKAFRKELRDCLLTELKAYSKEDPAYNKYLQVLKDFERPFDLNTQAQTQARLELRSYEPPAKTLYGASGCYKVLPKAEWFPAAVRAIDPESLLTLWPEAERKMMLLMLGRVACGAHGEQAVEGPIEHTFRAFSITIGRGDAGAGVGKSTFHTYLRDTLSCLGYRSTTLDNNLGRFGWAQRCLSDLLYCDDLNESAQSKLIKSELVKQIATNGTIYTEEKGLAGVEVKARTVLMACSNHSNSADLVGLDSGIKSRLCQLDTRTQKELTANGQDLRTKEHWETYGHSKEVLMAWVLRYASDYFLQHIGLGYDSATGTLKRLGPSVLQETITTLKSQFALDNELPHVKEMVTACLHLKALSLAYYKRQDNNKRTSRAKLVGIGAHLISCVLKIWLLDVKHKTPKGLEAFELPSLDRECIGYLKPKMALFTDLAKAKSPQGVMDTLLSEIKSTKGFGYPKSQALWVSMFSAEERDLESLVAHYEPIALSLYEEHDALSSSIDEIDKMVTH